MDEIIYIIAGLHVVFFLYGMAKEEKIALLLGGVMGIILSVSIIGESVVTAFAILLYSIFICYKAIFEI